MKVAIFIGSDSDYDVARETLEVLKEFDVSFALEVTSAHRSPSRTVELTKNYEEKGVEVWVPYFDTHFCPLRTTSHIL